MRRQEYRGEYHPDRGRSMNAERCTLPTSIRQDNDGVAERDQRENQDQPPELGGPDDYRHDDQKPGNDVADSLNLPPATRVALQEQRQAESCRIALRFGCVSESDRNDTETHDPRNCEPCDAQVISPVPGSPMSIPVPLFDGLTRRWFRLSNVSNRPVFRRPSRRDAGLEIEALLQ